MEGVKGKKKKTSPRTTKNITEGCLKVIIDGFSLQWGGVGLAGDKLLARNRLYKYMLAIFECTYLHFGFQNRFNYKENSSSYKHTRVHF